jgi:hypothetical protein
VVCVLKDSRIVGGLLVEISTVVPHVAQPGDTTGTTRRIRVTDAGGVAAILTAM